MGKTQKSISVPLEYWKKLEEMLRDYKDVCKELEISSTSQLLRVLGKLGEPRFLQLAEQVRKSRTSQI